MLLNGIRLDGLPTRSNHESDRHRTPNLVVDRDDAGLLDRRVLLQQFFDFDGKAILAIADEHIVDTVDKEMEPVLVAPQNVTGPVVSVFSNHFRGLLR